MPSRSLPLLIVAAAIVLAGCGRQPATNASAAGTASSGSAPANVLRLGNGAEPQDLDPQTITGVTEHHIVSALFEGLAAPDPVDLRPVPGLAQSWDISPDGRTYTFHLRPGIKWSDGRAITSADFIESYKRMLTPALAAEYANLIHDYVVNAKAYFDGTLTDFSQVGFRAPDERTLVVSLKQPVPYLLQIIACHYAWTPVPVHVISRFGGLDRKRTDWVKPGNLVGSGPYILKEWLPDQKITVVRNPHYWDAATVKIDTIEFHAITNEVSEEALFRTGQLDVTNTLPTAKIEVYRRDHPAELRIDPYLGVYYYMLNTAKPPLNDRRVRRALALAIDREAIVRNITRGGQIPAFTVSYPGTAGYTPTARLSGSIDEAKRLLAEAGFPEGRGMPSIELLYNTSEGHRAIAEAVQEMWRNNLGVNVQLVNQEWRVYLDMTHSKNFTMARAGWIADYVDPHSLLEIWEGSNGNNHTSWNHPEYNRLYQQALAAPDQAARYAAYARMDEILVDELPLIPLYHYTRVHAVSTRVRGYHANLLDNHPYKHLWLEAE